MNGLLYNRFYFLFLYVNIIPYVIIICCLLIILQRYWNDNSHLFFIKISFDTFISWNLLKQTNKFTSYNFSAIYSNTLLSKKNCYIYRSYQVDKRNSIFKFDSVFLSQNLDKLLLGYKYIYSFLLISYQIFSLCLNIVICNKSILLICNRIKYRWWNFPWIISFRRLLDKNIHMCYKHTAFFICIRCSKSMILCCIQGKISILTKYNPYFDDNSMLNWMNQLNLIE